MSTDDSTQNGAPGEGERIAKVLSRAGIASRRDAERLILEGRVTVNGETITSPAVNVTPKDRLAVDNEVVGAPEATRLWLYHKPAGLVTTEHDEEGRPTVFDDLPDDMPRVMSVGRLDLTSEGLLLLTNDGEIKRRLELPSTGWTRRYRVRIHGTPTNQQLQPLRDGVTVDDMDYQPMEVEIDRQQGSNCWLSVTLREGKNREIRRVMEHLGFTVNRLIRVSYGPFQLGELPSGEVEEVRAKIVRDQLGLSKPKAEPTRARKRPEPEDIPVFDEEPGDRPERDVLATARPVGATVKRELKSRVPTPRGERTDDAPRGRVIPRPDRKTSGSNSSGPFAKPRTWMRADEARAARDEAPAEEERPTRPRAVPGDRPRSAGYKSHGKPRGEDRPRSAGFKSHRDEGDRPARPYKPREDGDRPARPYKPREEGDRPQRSFRDRPEGDRGQGGDRPYKPRAPREEGGDRPARAYKPREGGDRPYQPRDGGGDRPYKPRGDGERPARAYSPRPQREGDDRPAPPYKPREGGDRPYKPREGGSDRPYKPREAGDRPYKPREGGDRPYKPREDGDRPARAFKPREGGDRPARPYKPREDGDRPQRGFKPSGPARSGGDRPERSFRPREDGAGRPPRAGGAPRPGGPGGPRKGPPRAGGFKGPRKG